MAEDSQPDVTHVRRVGLTIEQGEPGEPIRDGKAQLRVV